MLVIENEGVRQTVDAPTLVAVTLTVAYGALIPCLYLLFIAA